MVAYMVQLIIALIFKYVNGLYAISLYYIDYSLQIMVVQIIHSETNTVSGQNETGFSCDGSWKTFRVMFKEPIEIMQNQFYTASATLIVSCHMQFLTGFNRGFFRGPIVTMVRKAWLKYRMLESQTRKQYSHSFTQRAITMELQSRMAKFPKLYFSMLQTRNKKIRFYKLIHSVHVSRNSFIPFCKINLFEQIIFMS